MLNSEYDGFAYYLCSGQVAVAKVGNIDLTILMTVRITACITGAQSLGLNNIVYIIFVAIYRLLDNNHWYEPLLQKKLV
jgi:hypothetical protein